jgi:two-component system NtrC family sensor kinase
MISGVAHELNNPLATLMGHAQLLLESSASGETRRILGVMDSEAERCQKIVQSLLAFARHHAPERAPAHLGSLLRSTVDLLEYGMRSEGVRVELDVPEGLPLVLGDSHQLQQVFLNILQNACQALESISGERRVRVSARHEGERIRIEISDNGPGIDAAHLPRIFDPFFTTKEVGRGTGLGLSLAYGLVSEHGGSIEARNNPEGGACFSLTLPAGEGVEAAPTAPAERRDPGPAKRSVDRRQRILIVEDEELLATVIRDALEREGYAAELARNGTEALQHLDREAFDLMISDVKMPNMGGRELYAEVVRRAPALAGRMVFVTGDVVNPATRRFFEETGSRYITKPFKLTELRRVVRARLEEAERSG